MLASRNIQPIAKKEWCVSVDTKNEEGPQVNLFDLACKLIDRGFVLYRQHSNERESRLWLRHNNNSGIDFRIENSGLGFSGPAKDIFFTGSIHWLHNGCSSVYTFSFSGEKAIEKVPVMFEALLKIRSNSIEAVEKAGLK